ncbi:MAG: hypothetical protein IT285_03610, partial [Bdellovibrionales bacterium]|nr:hypothetical protein [Bdellovibrionales bacterium]
MRTALSMLLFAVLISSGCETTISGVGGGSGDDDSGDLVAVERIVSAGPSLSFNQFTGGVNDLALSPVTKLPGIVYYDKNSAISGTTTVGGLKFAFLDETGNWNIEVIDANYGTAVCGTALGICVGAPNAAAGGTASIMRVAYKSDGTPAVVYVYGMSAAGAAGNKQIRYAERQASGEWTIQVVFSAASTAGATNAANTATVDALKGLTLNFDATDLPHVTFSFYAQTLVGNSFIKYAYRTAGGTWNVSNITGSVTAGTVTALTQGAMQSGAVMCPANGRLIVMSTVIDAAAGVGKPVYIRCTATGADGGCTAWSSLTLTNGCTGATS